MGKETLPGLGDDETPHGIRAPSLMSVAIDLARVKEQLRYVVMTMKDREDRQDDRDEALRAALKTAVHEAVHGAVQPLDLRLKALEDAQLEQKTVIKTSIKWAGAAGTVVVFLWGLASKLIGL